MAKLARLPGFDRADRAEAEHPRVPRLRTRYYAFLSYSHKDKELADWLHRELERFRVPGSLSGKLTANGVVPRRLTPVFRDQQDLSAGGELAEEIKAALAASQFLVVLCSPTAAKSRWTNQEIESFKRTRPEGCVLAAVAAGEPFASDVPGREDEECFPPALRFKYDRRGHRTAKRAEPLAADFREVGEGRRLAFLKLVAGMLGVGLDELVQREQTRRSRRLAYLAAASIAGMAVTSTLAVTAIQARNEAREQRREAEGLVAFMLGDLKDKLEPIGKLDALDGVGARVLAYYQKQDASELSDAALLQRSKALSLMAEVANARGDAQTALKLYREALAGTAETMRRKPDDPEPIFEHAQNVFYVGEIAADLGQLKAAESAMRQYKQLALKMVALQPDNMKYRMEVEYAEVDLGTVYWNQRRFAEAASQFAQGLQTIEALATADPGNADYQKSLTETLAWLADAQMSAGQLESATKLRERQVAMVTAALSRTGDVIYRQKRVPAERALGNLYAARGQMDRAVQHLKAAVADSDQLAAIESDNTLWELNGYRARFDLIRYLIATSDIAAAGTETDNACAAVKRLLSKDSQRPEWRAGLRDCWIARARVALSSKQPKRAASFAEEAVAVGKTVKTSDPVQEKYMLASAYLLLGEALKASGNPDGAKTAWEAGLGVIPPNAAERPSETKEHRDLLDRLGADSAALTRRLDAIGYRNPVT
jgi:tetratricopeptide (TPR) repeat protein